MENQFLGENMFNILRQTLRVTEVCPPLDFLRFLPEFRDMPIDRPILPADLLSNLDAARPMLQYLSDANLLNPTSFMEAKELFNFINNLDFNSDFRGGFYPRFGNILNNLSEYSPKVDYNDLR